MEDKDLAQMLIENSFQEGRLYWNRHNTFLVAQTIFLGFFLNFIAKDNHTNLLIFCLAVELVGLVIAGLHIWVLKISKKYQECWLEPFWRLVEQHKNNANLKVLAGVKKAHEEIPIKSTCMVGCLGSNLD